MIKILATVTALLFIALLITGYFLKQSYKENGDLQVKLDASIASLKLEEENKAITEGVANDLQTANTKLRAHRDRLLKQSNKCIPITPRHPRRNNETSKRTELVGKVGIGEGFVIGLLAEGDGYRNQVIACQQFLTKVKTRNNLNN